MEELITAISQVGFPISIAVYLLVRFEQKMERLTGVNDGLRAEIQALKTEILQLKEELLNKRRR